MQSMVLPFCSHATTNLVIPHDGGDYVQGTSIIITGSNQGYFFETVRLKECLFLFFTR